VWSTMKACESENAYGSANARSRRTARVWAGGIEAADAPSNACARAVSEHVCGRRREQFGRVSEFVCESDCERGCEPVCERGWTRADAAASSSSACETAAQARAQAGLQEAQARLRVSLQPHIQTRMQARTNKHERPPPSRTLPRLADSGKIPKFASGLCHADLHTARVPKQCTQSGKATSQSPAPRSYSIRLRWRNARRSCTGRAFRAVSAPHRGRPLARASRSFTGKQPCCPGTRIRPCIPCSTSL
jgi:hypothetical protein